MNEFAKTCERAAREAGRILVEWRDRAVVRAKGPADLVTDADLAAQEAIREMLLREYPDHRFLGEEDDAQLQPKMDSGRATPPSTDASEYRWLVDPLDGTTNYVHGFEHYCVSVALERAGQLVVSAVFDPNRDECFTAQSGHGAFLNQRRLATSATTALGKALVAVSFPARMPRQSADIGRFVEVLHRCRATRRLGSAALSLCYVAAGRLDAYWATSIKPWDIAAGALLVLEAGGTVTGLNGSRLDLCNPQLVASATGALHGQMLAALAATA
jgi:myo-inositol-1(or 4)-monophosphatase